jgi:hypothetical protein
MDITLTGTLRNDQTAGLQDDDDAIGGNLSGLLARFANFLNGTPLAGDPAIPGTLALDAGQLAYANSVEAVVSSTLSLTVNAQGSDVDDLFFSAPDGTLFDGDQVFINADPTKPLQTTSGSNIYLHSYDGGNIVLATTSSTAGAGEVVAAFYLNEAGDHLSATIQTVTFMAIEHPDATNPDDAINWSSLLNVSASGSITFDFDELKSGSSLWVAVGNSTAAMLVTGGNPLVDGAGKKTNVSDVIHTSQGGVDATIGVNNQLFDNIGESAVFTLVTGMDALVGADDGAASDYVVDHTGPKADGIDYVGYINTNGAGIFLSQSQGNDAKDFDILLWEAGGDAGGAQTAEDGTNYIPGLASDTAVDVASVTITDDDGDIVGVWGAGGTLASGDTVTGNVSANGVANVTVTFSGNTINVEGALGEYTVNWTSAAGQTFNRFELIAQGGQFDVGRVEIDNVTGDTQAVGGSMFVDDDGPAISPIIPDGSVAFAVNSTDNDLLNGASGTDVTGTFSITAVSPSTTTLLGVTLQARIDPNDNTLVNIYEEKNSTDGFQSGAGGDVLYYTLSLEDLLAAGNGSITAGLDSWVFTVVNAPAAPPLTFDFDQLPSGANLFGSVADSPAGVGLFVFGRDVVLNASGKYTNTSDVIHTSQGGIGATIGVNNQMFDGPNDDGAYFTFVDDIVDNFLSGVSGGLTSTEADNANNIQYSGGLHDTTGAFMGISQGQGNELADLRLSAFHLTGDPQEEDLIAASGSNQVDITRVIVYDAQGVEIEDTDGSSNDAVITVDLGGLTGLVTGLEAGMTVEWVTASAHNQVLVEAVTGKFDMGFFGISEPQQVPDHFYDFTVRLTDADGDFVSDTFRVVVDNPLV